ncbi:hypothetical protein NSQ26_13345 [Bacillus sp. FSL W7-1360]
MSYFKLVHFELSRVWKIYVGLIGLVLIGQLSAIWFGANQFMKELTQFAREKSISLKAASTHEEFYMNSPNGFLREPWFYYPIMASIAVLLLYMILIWYRDWFGKHAFIHRLLLLPTTRAPIYFAKLSTIMLLVFGLLALQIVIFFIGAKMIAVMVPETLYDTVSLASFTEEGVFPLLLPAEALLFFAYYTLGFTFVTVVFSIILFERCFRLKGFFFGAILAVCFVFLHVAPYAVANQFSLYPSESVLIHLGVTIFTLIFYTPLNLYLLKRKVTV